MTIHQQMDMITEVELLIHIMTANGYTELEILESDVRK
jgi:hypothetical protein